jgi:hypothetical protein
MRKRFVISISLVVAVVTTVAAVVIGADLPQASLSPDRVVKGATPLITIWLDKNISGTTEIKGIRLGGQVFPTQQSGDKASVLLPRLYFVGRADFEVIGKDEKQVAVGQLTYVECADGPSCSLAWLLTLYLLLIFALPLTCTIYDIYKSYKERSSVLDKLGNNLTSEEIKNLLLEMDVGPTGLTGLTRGIVAVTLVLVLAVAVFHLVVFVPKVPDIAEKLLMLLAGTLTAITGFYFGTKATSDTTRPSSPGAEGSKVSGLKIANAGVNPESAKPGDKFRLIAEISGGEQPYDYIVSFKPEIMQPLKKRSDDGKVAEEITVPQDVKPGEVELALTVQDKSGKSLVSDGPIKLAVQASEMKIENVNVEPKAAKPGDAFKVNAEISGGVPPYDYAISFTPGTIPTLDKQGSDGKIAENFTVPDTIMPGTALQLTIHAKDGSGKSVDSGLTLSIG